MVIWKFVLDVTDRQSLKLPQGAQILSVANQNGLLCLWAMVDPKSDLQARVIEIVGTGNPMSELPLSSRKFIGTAVMNPFVWHVFELA